MIVILVLYLFGNPPSLCYYYYYISNEILSLFDPDEKRKILPTYFITFPNINFKCHIYVIIAFNLFRNKN